jgi:hypothetical protein
MEAVSVSRADVLASRRAAPHGAWLSQGWYLQMSVREEIRKRLIAQGVDPVEADRIAVFEAP